MRYLIDGYPPDDVAQRLGVNRTWCRRMIARLEEGK
jgi:DNA-directed RNA polymerase subunit N (RpoN/RPB10)